jgi:lysophospholipase L1-like esterase
MTYQVCRYLTCVLGAVLCAFSGALAQSVPQIANSFALKDGARVLFYGDSITEQREYTEDVEEYVLTRFPQWKVTFFNAGVGGDKVSGGGAGPVDLRLQRDVFPQHPDVITVMLGMNDGFSRPDEPGIFSTYSDGYRHIVESMQTALPQAQITLIQPSPYDDITREPRFPGGYNSVMLRYGNFVAELSRERKTQLADFNSPVTTLLKRLNQQAPDLARQLLPDRVHPGQGGHWVMAESLLRAWHAPALVSSVAVDVGSKVSTTEVHNAKITELRKFKGGLIWTQVDDALPLPLPPVEVDPVVALAVKYSDLVQSLDQ